MTEQQNEVLQDTGSLRGNTAFWFRWLCRITAAISLYNIAKAHIEHLPVSAVFCDVLNYYRSIFYPVAACLRHIVAFVHIRIPLSNDYIILYCLVGTSFARFSMLSSLPDPLDEDERMKLENMRLAKMEYAESNWYIFSVLVLPPILVIVWPICFAAYGIPLFSSHSTIRHRSRRDLKALAVGTLQELRDIVCIFVLFLLLNAATPSISWQSGS